MSIQLFACIEGKLQPKRDLDGGAVLETQPNFTISLQVLVKYEKKKRDGERLR